MAGTREGPAAFEAILYPNPPLGRHGFVILMLATSGVAAAVGSAFFMAGAWPVSGFLGLDIVLLYLAFRWAQRESRRSEVIRLDGMGLHVRRIEPNGRHRDWRFEPYWVRVSIDGRRPGPGSLVVASHGDRVSLGHFLTGDERLSLADELNKALSAYRA